MFVHFGTFLILGILVGFIAHLMRPGKAPTGWLTTTLVAIGGALFVGFIGDGLGLFGNSAPSAVVASVGGAVAAVVAERLIRERRAAARARQT
jgi:uncharacterized membrane protein YeaQ/YmgE (transglycosylase-associated protein family)